MPKCQICHENEAVIILTRIEENRRISEGICLKCAMDKNIAGLEEVFARSGVNRDNVDEIQSRINEVMNQMQGRAPGQFLEALMNSDFDLGQAMEALKSQGDGSDEGNPSRDAILGSTREPSQLSELMNANMGMSADRESSPNATEQRKNRRQRERRKKYLDQFGTNLTDLAREGKIDRIIGREKELNRMVQILNRRNKNNPALLGEPGVGKTALAQGLAVRIVHGQVPAKLLDREIYQLDMTSMVAGTQFRGQFESRMKGVVDDARSAGNVILVIDELHNIMGAGDAEGAMNAANILKPALAQGEICVIGCTTLDEYRRFIEKDSALERRFQKVIVEEPDEKDCLEILKGVKPYYEAHHNVSFPDKTLEAAVRLSSRYIQERYLPDKAIDLLDEAGSRVNLDNALLTELKKKEDERLALEDEMSELQDSMEGGGDEAGRAAFFEKKAKLTSQILRLNSEIEELNQRNHPVEISENDIADVVEMWTGIPVKHITESEGEKLLQLEQRLHRRLIGQEEAVTALAKAIRRKRAGFGKKNKPVSFLFVGPTGVGKTELAKALSEALFDSEDELVRLDMSEFMESHTVSKLIGSPPGYVGYDDGGQLTEKIRRHPYSVILLDEIEKAHKDVYNMLLQILDDGRLTDSHGRVVNFANTVIIMTSNAGTTLKANGMGFGADPQRSMKSRVDTVLKEIFRPEFLNRIDEIIVFSDLSQKNLRGIVDLILAEVKESMKHQGYKLEITAAAKDALVEKGYDPKFGARPLRKTVGREIEEKLSDMLLDGQLKGKKGVKIGCRKGEFIFELID